RDPSQLSNSLCEKSPRARTNRRSEDAIFVPGLFHAHPSGKNPILEVGVQADSAFKIRIIAEKHSSQRDPSRKGASNMILETRERSLSQSYSAVWLTSLIAPSRISRPESTRSRVMINGGAIR